MTLGVGAGPRGLCPSCCGRKLENMWKQQIALRSVLGDPWPSGSIQRGAIRADSDIDDREALVASMNEINRMGRDTNRTAQQHRDVTEQAIRSASVSAEMLSRIISGSDAERERRRREGKVRARPSVHASPPQPCPGGTGYTCCCASACRG